MTALSQIFQGGFDAATVEPAKSRDFGVMPAGPYDVEITGAEVKDTKAGTGQYLEVENTIISPEQFAGRKVWARINLQNPNPEAERIGREELSALCRAVGVGVLKDTTQLFQKILRVRLKIDRRDANNPKNEISGYESHAGSTPPVNTGRPAANAAAAPAAPAKAAPWAKK